MLTNKRRGMSWAMWWLHKNVMRHQGNIRKFKLLWQLLNHQLNNHSQYKRKLQFWDDLVVLHKNLRLYLLLISQPSFQWFFSLSSSNFLLHNGRRYTICCPTQKYHTIKQMFRYRTRMNMKRRSVELCVIHFLLARKITEYHQIILFPNQIMNQIYTFVYFTFSSPRHFTCLICHCEERSSWLSPTISVSQLLLISLHSTRYFILDWYNEYIILSLRWCSDGRVHYGS